MTSIEYKPQNEPQPEFLLACHPAYLPKPFTVFKPHSAVMGFDFDHYKEFGNTGDAYIAEFAVKLQKQPVENLFQM
ncbi:MAG: hypothetical protein A2Y15_00520 [Clostridiales bacterium GWF2_36_10]|nr:MAG: hypothetical protein A2Y15_00520 [Clostridiales bacterium GWF2_36_10]